MPKKKIKIAVLMGGPSAEREISLITGKAICENLDKKKYEILPVEVDKNRKFLMDQKKYLTYNSSKLKKSGGGVGMVKWNDDDWRKSKVDMVFIALHGTFGEDGSLQGLLESLNIPYTGSGVLASALAMNKVFANQIYFANGLPFPRFIHFKKHNWKESREKILSDAKERIGLPCVVKPVDQGSAVGVSIVKTEEEMIKAIDKNIKQYPWLMVQRFVKGQEATCGVIEKEGKLMSLPPTHILPNLGEFYDYKSKYAAGGSTHICPADFSHEVNHAIQDLAIKCHIALGCRGMSRTDVFVVDDGNLYILETNTIPGMTQTSLFPEAASKAGISFSEMLDLIVKASL